LAAAERYYETWGRTWERAALVRARPVAGDLAFGARLLGALGPFVWRRNVDPRIADEMMALVLRARAEMAGDPERDLKLGPGGRGAPARPRSDAKARGQALRVPSRAEAPAEGRRAGGHRRRTLARGDRRGRRSAGPRAAARGDGRDGVARLAAPPPRARAASG